MSQVVGAAVTAVLVSRGTAAITVRSATSGSTHGSSHSSFLTRNVDLLCSGRETSLHHQLYRVPVASGTQQPDHIHQPQGHRPVSYRRRPHPVRSVHNQGKARTGFGRLLAP